MLAYCIMFTAFVNQDTPTLAVETSEQQWFSGG